MIRLIPRPGSEPWKRRLLLPAYQLKEAARYADTHTTTVSYWHRATCPVLPGRRPRAALSYFQLVEVAFVAAMRAAGVSLQKIRRAREYIANNIKAEFPFATLQFKTEGQHILLDLESIDSSTTGKLIEADQFGQYTWKEVVGNRFTQFEYENKLAMRWYLAGRDSPIVIDPQISFGAPAISGVPTWAIRGRWEAGEQEEDIADDFDLSEADVGHALRFEGVEVTAVH